MIIIGVDFHPKFQFLGCSSNDAKYAGHSDIRVLILGNRNGVAATEFQKITEHKYLIGNFPLGSLAHLGLGRAYALTGDAAKARVAYQDFFALWKDADPDVPVLKEAKAEYAKLQ